MIKQLSLNTKLMIISLVAIFGMIFIVLVSWYSFSQQHKFFTIKSLTQQLNSDMLTLRRNEKDFMARKDTRYLDEFKKSRQKLEKDYLRLVYLTQDVDISHQEIKDFHHYIQNYTKTFFTLAKKEQTFIGVNQKLTQHLADIQIYLKNHIAQSSLIQLLQLQHTINRFLLYSDIKAKQAFLQTYQHLNNTVYTRFNPSTSPNRPLSDILKDVHSAFIKLIALKKEIGLTHQTGLHGQMRNSVHKTESILKQMNQSITKDLQSVSSWLYILLGIFAFGIILAVGLTTSLIATNIISSIQILEKQLSHFFNYLHHKNNTVTFVEVHTDDIIGKMSKTINQNIQKVQTKMQQDEKQLSEFIDVFSKIQEGDLSHRIDTKTTDETLIRLKDIFNTLIKNVEENSQETISVLEEYTNYNYHRKIDITQRKGDFYIVANSVNMLGDAIVKTLKENKKNGQLLHQYAQSLNDNFDYFSKASKEQNQNLNTTVEGIENINTNIHKNNDSIKQMTDYTNKLISAVKTGLTKIDETVSSVENIDNQTQDISNAIEIIESIAFQTNILSLNAAVEASKAGDVGRGFAVVAQEVRELALKSTQAVNDIQEIVQHATNRVEEGKSISDDMKNGYHTLHENIEHMVGLIKIVSDSIYQQNDSITQITGSINALQTAQIENHQIANKTNSVAKNLSIISQKVVQSTQKQSY